MCTTHKGAKSAAYIKNRKKFKIHKMKEINEVLLFFGINIVGWNGKL